MQIMNESGRRPPSSTNSRFERGTGSRGCSQLMAHHLL